MTNETRNPELNPLRVASYRRERDTLHHRRSPARGAVHMVMLELGIPHTIEFVDIHAQPHVLIESRAVYKKLNPKDAVPALELGSGSSSPRSA